MVVSARLPEIVLVGTAAVTGQNVVEIEYGDVLVRVVHEPFVYQPVRDRAVIRGLSGICGDRNTRPRRTYAVTLKIVSGKRSIVGGRAVLKLVVAVKRSSHRSRCPLRTRGLITLVDNEALLSNGKNRDSVSSTFPRAGGPRSAPNGGRACATHVQGRNNADAGPRTSPPTGGPPSGGQWAKVTISR